MNITVYAIPGIHIETDPGTIDNVVAKVFGVTPACMRERTRKRGIVEARQTAMYMYRKKTKFSLSEIGYMLGKFDHATVLHACNQVRNLLEFDKEYAVKFNQVKEMIV